MQWYNLGSVIVTYHLCLIHFSGAIPVLGYSSDSIEGNMLPSSRGLSTSDNADFDADSESQLTDSHTVLPYGVSLIKKFSDISSTMTLDSLCTQKQLSMSMDSLRQSSTSCDEVTYHVSRWCCVCMCVFECTIVYKLHGPKICNPFMSLNTLHQLNSGPGLNYYIQWKRC